MTTATTTHDLGQGWFASLTVADDLSETLTIRNPDSGQRFDLDAAETAKLRAIFQLVDESYAVAHAEALLDSVAADLNLNS